MFEQNHQPTRIKTVLFDLGNVLLSFSHGRMCRQIAELFHVPTEQVRELLFNDPLYASFDRGGITERDFHRQLEQQFGSNCEINDLRKAAADIFAPISGMGDLLKNLRVRRLRLVLLSNTCPTHIEWIQAHFDTLQQFDEVVLSYKVGACKPEAEIFEAALSKIACQPSECLYTDDISAYVEAAKAYGLHAELFTTPEAFRSTLREYGLHVGDDL